MFLFKVLERRRWTVGISYSRSDEDLKWLTVYVPADAGAYSSAVQWTAHNARPQVPNNGFLHTQVFSSGRQLLIRMIGSPV
jgi:hypothetical protein